MSSSKRYAAIILLIFCSGVYSTRVSAQTVVDSAEATVSASVTALPSVDPVTGGGGSGSKSGVQFSGLAYPHANVSLLQGTVVAATVVADATGKFSILFSDIRNASRLIFSLFAVDTVGRRSTLLNFPVAFYTGSLTDVRNIRFAPTITTDKVAIRQNDFLTIDGAGLPELPIALVFEGLTGRSFSAQANQEGVYRLTAPITLMQGEYLVRARYEGDSRSSTALRVIIGGASIPRVDTADNIPGDCNFDQRVTILDFSVVAFWFGKKNPPSCVDINRDGAITLVDFSILAFYWNG